MKCSKTYKPFFFFFFQAKVLSISNAHFIERRYIKRNYQCTHYSLQFMKCSKSYKLFFRQKTIIILSLFISKRLFFLNKKKISFVTKHIYSFKAHLKFFFSKILIIKHIIIIVYEMLQNLQTFFFSFFRLKFYQYQMHTLLK